MGIRCLVFIAMENQKKIKCFLFRLSWILNWVKIRGHFIVLFYSLMLSLTKWPFFGSKRNEENTKFLNWFGIFSQSVRENISSHPLIEPVSHAMTDSGAKRVASIEGNWRSTSRSWAYLIPEHISQAQNWNSRALLPLEIRMLRNAIKHISA